MNYVRKVLDVDKFHAKGIMGKGVTIAILDTGAALHKDISGRIVKFYDMVSGKMKMYDNNGHGSHIAGICAGDGSASNGRYRGMCPEAGLVIIKVLDKQGKGKEETVIKASEWIIRNRKRYNINIVNISFGSFIDEENDCEMIRAIEKMWDVGLVVVAAAGNNGPEEGTITSPGISSKIITVGALDDKRKVYIDGKYVNDYSGAGCWKKGLKKPEVIAPATMIKSCRNSSKGYVVKSGTSMAAPIVSGCIGLMIGANPGIRNFEVKEILSKTSIDRGLSRDRQGYGLICLEKLISHTN